MYILYLYNMIHGVKVWQIVALVAIAVVLVLVF